MAMDFLARLWKCTGRVIALSQQNVKVNIKVYCVMGKVLSGKLPYMQSRLVAQCCHKHKIMMVDTDLYL